MMGMHPGISEMCCSNKDNLILDGGCKMRWFLSKVSVRLIDKYGMLVNVWALLS